MFIFYIIVGFLKNVLFRGGSRGGGGGSWGSGLPPFGGPPNFIKRGKMAHVCTRKLRVLVINSYPDPPPPFRNPVSAPDILNGYKFIGGWEGNEDFQTNCVFKILDLLVYFYTHYKNRRVGFIMHQHSQESPQEYTLLLLSEMTLSNHRKSGNLTNVKMWLINK